MTLAPFLSLDTLIARSEMNATINHHQNQLLADLLHIVYNNDVGVNIGL